MKIQPVFDGTAFDGAFVKVSRPQTLDPYVSLEALDAEGDKTEVWLTPEEAVRVAEALLRTARAAKETR